MYFVLLEVPCCCFQSTLLNGKALLLVHGKEAELFVVESRFPFYMLTHCNGVRVIMYRVAQKSKPISVSSLNRIKNRN